VKPAAKLPAEQGTPESAVPAQPPTEQVTPQSTPEQPASEPAVPAEKETPTQTPVEEPKQEESRTKQGVPQATKTGPERTRAMAMAGARADKKKNNLRLLPFNFAQGAEWQTKSRDNGNT